MRWASPTATRWAQLQEFYLQGLQLIGNESGQLRTLDGLSSIQLYYFRGDGWSNAQSRATSRRRSGRGAGRGRLALRLDRCHPPPRHCRRGGGRCRVATQPQQLPTGVRLVLGFASEGEELKLTRDVVMSPQASQARNHDHATALRRRQRGSALLLAMVIMMLVVTLAGRHGVAARTRDPDRRRRTRTGAVGVDAQRRARLGRADPGAKI